MNISSTLGTNFDKPGAGVRVKLAVMGETKGPRSHFPTADVITRSRGRGVMVVVVVVVATAVAVACQRRY